MSHNGDMGMSVAEHSTPRVRAAIEILRCRGERITRARCAVLEVLDATEEHVGAEAIARLAEERAPGLHRATVYRALATLGELELVSHTHLSGSSAVYHLCVSVPDSEPVAAVHAHAQCTRCDAVFDVSLQTLNPLASALMKDLGFELEPEHAGLLGVCSACRVELKD